MNDVKERLLLNIQNYFEPWVNLTKKNKEKILLDMGNYYLKNKKKDQLLKFHIVNNKIVNFSDKHLYDERPYLLKRSGIMRNIIENAISNPKHKTRNLTFYISLKDYVVTEKYPIFGFAKEESRKGILIPDWTFEKAYKSTIKENWDSQFREIENECKKKDFNSKKDIVFFQGSNTSKKKTNIRENLELLSKDEDKMVVLVDKKPYSSVTEWCNYRYLYDLPGSYPWSVRFKELFVTSSLVIKVDVEDRWVNFYSNIFIPNKDYIQLFIRENVNSSNKMEDAKKIKKMTLAIMDFINKKPEMYDIMTNSAYRKIKLMDMSMVNFYVGSLLDVYQNIFF